MTRRPALPCSSWAGIELDAARHHVRHHGQAVELTAKEFALLRWFLLHPQEVHSAERLLEHVWDANADPFTNTVRVTISNLRRKLAEAAGEGDQPIETLPGRGYRLRAVRVTARRPRHGSPLRRLGRRGRGGSCRRAWRSA